MLEFVTTLERICHKMVRKSPRSSSVKTTSSGIIVLCSSVRYASYFPLCFIFSGSLWNFAENFSHARKAFIVRNLCLQVNWHVCNNLSYRWILIQFPGLSGASMLLKRITSILGLFQGEYTHYVVNTGFGSFWRNWLWQDHSAPSIHSRRGDIIPPWCWL